MHASLHAHFRPLLQAFAAASGALGAAAGPSDSTRTRKDTTVSAVAKQITDLEAAVLRLRQNVNGQLVQFVPEPEVASAVAAMEEVCCDRAIRPLMYR